jgi:HSP20 family protein
MQMKHETSTELTVAPKAVPESMFLQKMDEIENRIARRAYELFASSGFTDGHDVEDWLLAESELFGRMPVEVTETEKDVTVKAGMPGFAEKDIEIKVEPRRLFISGMHEEKSEDKKKGETVYSERSDQVCRTINLPAEVDPDKVKKTLSKGELEITLPKKEIGKKIAIEQKAA